MQLATPRAPPSGDKAAALPLLDVRNIEVLYDEVILVLRGLSLAVPQGAIVTLLGANGAGKSTTLKPISGFLKTENGALTSGEILFGGTAIQGHRGRRAAQFQEPQKLQAAEALAFACVAACS